MAIVELVQAHLQRLHRDLEGALEGLTREQLHWRPGEGCNHIAFSAWHYTRTEDNLIRFVLQDRRTPVWLENGWHEHFGLERVAQGTGMEPEQAVAVHLPSVEAFLPYMHEVWASTDEYLGSITDAVLDRTVTVRPMGERPVRDVLTENLLTHGFSHLGEIWVLRGLQGFRGSPV